MRDILEKNSPKRRWLIIEINLLSIKTSHFLLLLQNYREWKTKNDLSSKPVEFNFEMQPGLCHAKATTSFLLLPSKLHGLNGLKEHHLLASSFCRSEVWAWSSWALCSGMEHKHESDAPSQSQVPPTLKEECMVQGTHITEQESWGSSQDSACHNATSRGRSDRGEVMSTCRETAPFGQHRGTAGASGQC